MKRGSLPRTLLLLALSVSLLPGCASVSRTTPPIPPEEAPAAPRTEKAPAAPPTEKAPAAPPGGIPSEISAADKAFAEGMSAMREGGQERALELFSAAWKEKPGHAGVAGEFDGALLALKKNGDAAYAQGKLEDAGKRWMGTLRFITHPAANPRGYPFTRSEVQAKVDRLSESLMEKALLEYRKGNVQAAIAYWKTILAYDPSNAEAVKSLNTATTQLDHLKKLPPAPVQAPSPAPLSK